MMTMLMLLLGYDVLAEVSWHKLCANSARACRTPVFASLQAACTLCLYQTSAS